MLKYEEYVTNNININIHNHYCPEPEGFNCLIRCPWGLEADVSLCIYLLLIKDNSLLNKTRSFSLHYYLK